MCDKYDDNHHMASTRTNTGTKGQETRERILAAAAARFRQHGYADTSVNQVMRDAGLTHGGFYAHFASKEDLFAQAVRHATDASGDWLESRLQGLDGDAWVERWVDIYMSDSHCEHPEGGCPIPALMPEIARSGPDAGTAFASSLARRFDRLCPHLPFERTEAERRALAAYAQMAGAVMLSRTLGLRESASLRRDVAHQAKHLLLGRVVLPDAEDEGGRS